MSDSDNESNFGALLFGDEANEAPPEYPIETLMVDRAQNMREGSTNGDFVPLYHCFDNITFTHDATTPKMKKKEAEQQLAVLSERLTRVQLQPLAVHYRNKRHSLWGHRLWNAAKYLSKRMDQRCIDVRGKTVLELGAGLGVPSLVAYRNGAKVVVVTDYPDDDLIDIIRLNVEENCQPEFVDADVREAQAAEDGETKAARGGCITAVEPLLWGKSEHIKKVMQYTGGNGYDIVILSDILFNHVCNDDLVDTLLRTLSHSSSAAGYCVFSHHRAYKQLQDFEFFDKCVARGLVYEQVDEQAYPMMFPEDRGPEEVRMPVKCYKITRRYDRVGAPLDLAAIFDNFTRVAEGVHGKGAVGGSAQEVSCFDVVIQGTGLSQSLLAAALARSGLKVLHCDAESLYGGSQQTMGLDQFRRYLDRAAQDEARRARVASMGHVPACETHLYVRPRVPGTEAPHILVDKLSHDTTTRHRYAIDLLPASYMANGAVIQKLVQADMMRTMEFQFLGGGFFFLEAGTDTHANHLVPVPLSRADMFSTSAVGLLEKRRVMSFIKDVEASLAEQLHAKTASPADSADMQKAAAAESAAQAASTFAKELEGKPDMTLSELVSKKYGLAGRALDVVTLMGQLDCLPNPAVENASAEHPSHAGLLESVQLVRSLLTSVGTFGSATPFIVPAYGASELSQNTCRTAAVWGAIYVLQRGITRIVVDEEKELQYAVLSNGQHVPTRVIVTPEELTRPLGARRMALPVRLAGWKPVLELEERRAKGTLREGLTSDELAALVAGGHDQQLSRVVVIAKRPLIRMAHVRAAKGEKAGAEASEEPPVAMALTRAACKGRSSGSGAPVVHVVQQSGVCEQIMPSDTQEVLLHFTANAAELPQAALEAFVMEQYFSMEAGVTDPAVVGLNKDEDVLFCASYTLSAMQLAIDSMYGDDTNASNEIHGKEACAEALLVDIPSATRASHAFAIGECEKLHQATERDRRRVLHEADPEANTAAEASDATEEVSSKFLRVLGLPSLPSQGLLNDSESMRLAETVYHKVVASIAGGPEGMSEEQLKKFEFLERQPPLV